jgi:molecular chaperone GrpE
MPLHPDSDPHRHALTGTESDDLVDLSLVEEGPTDLQALADEVAESTQVDQVDEKDEINEFGAPAGEPTGMALAPSSGPQGASPAGIPVPPTEVLEKPDHLQELLASLDQAQTRLRAMETSQNVMSEQYRRLAADFLNFRSRANRDNQLAVDQAERRLLLEILQVLDNFERGLGAAYPSVEAFRDGIELIHKQFLDTLRRNGVSAIELNVGDPFDASHAEALTTISRTDLPDHSVASVFERGFLLRDLLLRPARVIVNHQPSGGDSEAPEKDNVQ